MEEDNKPKFPKHLDHLNKTYVEELGFRLWVTKGVRFKAHARLTKIDELSSKSISYLTAYLIIFGLIGVYQSQDKPFIDTKYINFGSTVGSILLLIFSQLENAMSYKLEAHKFHSCALEVSALHDSIRMRKTLLQEKTETDIDFCKNIDINYVSLLNKYPNHIDIDYQMFRIEKKNYFEVKGFSTYWMPIKHFIKIELVYHLLVYLPPITFFFYLFYKTVFKSL